MSEKTTDTNQSPIGASKSQPLITEANFQLLRSVQQRLTEATGFSPQVSKLLNSLITKEALNDLEQRFKEQIRNLDSL